MKTIIIERCSNGWIVRPFTPGRCDWAVGTEPEIAVYTRLEDLQSDLPKLLSYAEGQ